MARKRSTSQSQRSRQEQPASSNRTRQFIVASILGALVIACYIPLFSNSFIDFDDPEYITQNSYIRNGLTFDSWIWAWTSLRSGNWHPLTWMSHALDVSISGLEPTGHHFTSLLIHVLNVVLLFMLLFHSTKRLRLAVIVAALFGLHPLAVESVAWAAERKNVLCTFFFLVAIAVHGWYAEHPTKRRYLLLMLVFAMGLLAKPMVITLPFVLLLLDYWPFRRLDVFSNSNSEVTNHQLSIKSAMVEKFPLLLMVIPSAIITLIAQSSAGAIASAGAIPFLPRVANALHSYLEYILKALWPVGLVPFYPRAAPGVPQIIISILFIVAVSVTAWRLRATRPYLIVGWLFYVGTLVPVIGLVQVGDQAIADRYTYIPMIGIFVAVVWLIDEFATTYKVQGAFRISIAAVAVAICGALTWRQVRLWHDDIQLWSYTIDITKNNSVAEDNLGIALLKQGNTEEAIHHFYIANRLNPTDPISAANVATDLLQRGRIPEAIEKYQVALQRAAFVPMLLPNIHSNLGSAFFKQGNLKQARQHYDLALSLNPEDRVARAGLQKIDQLISANAPK